MWKMWYAWKFYNNVITKGEWNGNNINSKYNCR